MLRRVLKERRLFMQLHTALFTVVFMAVLIWTFEGPIGPGLFLFLAPVCWGAGWLLAFYLWHLNAATEYETGPLRPAKSEGKKEEDRQAAP